MDSRADEPPPSVSIWVIVADGHTNRRRVPGHRAMLRAALPADGRAIEGWLRRPAGRSGPCPSGRMPMGGTQAQVGPRFGGFAPIADRRLSVGRAKEAAGSPIKGD